jgi:hypothetical protein
MSSEVSGRMMSSGATWKSIPRGRLLRTAAVLGVGVGLAGMIGLGGCYHEGPQRPSVDTLDPGDRGLQSMDINQAADQMAASLLSSRQLNESRTRWTMVVGRMEDHTADREAMVNYDLFLQALRARLYQQGQGRVELIVNRDKFYQERAREREDVGGADPYGQTGRSGPPPAPDAINPDFMLTGVAMDLPNRRTNYYQLQFDVIDLRTRGTPWTGLYTVKVAR